MKLLGNCKTWGGSCISVDKMHEILKAKPNEQKHIVRTELSTMLILINPIKLHNQSCTRSMELHTRKNLSTWPFWLTMTVLANTQ